MEILLIEDEPKTLQSLRQGLEENGYNVSFAFDGTSGLQMARKGNFGIIISDIIMPGINGLDLCRQLRAERIQTPVLMLTALGATDDVVTGLDAGADDYLIKPFEFRELLARVRALAKRSRPEQPTSGIMRYADLELNTDTREVSRQGKSIELTPREFALLHYLLQYPGRVFSKAEIAANVWDVDFDTGTNVVEVYVNYLRKKIDRQFDSKLIHTRPGMGYFLKEEKED
jgi:two-component system copper resistance phosphate regulon response regulator CusR